MIDYHWTGYQYNMLDSAPVVFRHSIDRYDLDPLLLLTYYQEDFYYAFMTWADNIQHPLFFWGENLKNSITSCGILEYN